MQTRAEPTDRGNGRKRRSTRRSNHRARPSGRNPGPAGSLGEIPDSNNDLDHRQPQPRTLQHHQPLRPSVRCWRGCHRCPSESDRL